MIRIRTSPGLLAHLRKHEHDGSTVATVLFGGGRLHYPGRQHVEMQLGHADPYTLELEARVIDGFDKRTAASIRFLSRLATDRVLNDELIDPTLQLLWDAHASYRGEPTSPSLDRLVAALVEIQANLLVPFPKEIGDGADVLISGLHAFGFPPTRAGLEELFDGAPPASVGLGIVEL